MSLLSDPELRPALGTAGAARPHAYTPIVEVVNKKRVTVGWICRDCLDSSEELPPLEQRRTGCPFRPSPAVPRSL